MESAKVKNKKSIILKLTDGGQIDLYTLSRKQRRDLYKQFPGLKRRVEAAEAELAAEADKNGAEF